MYIPLDVVSKHDVSESKALSAADAVLFYFSRKTPTLSEKRLPAEFLSPLNGNVSHPYRLVGVNFQ
ncbi:hypothetical protein [Halomonas sp. BM-2019]|uniref:hypothetical protein n=1 Tax=Halomonas sp. BM-2019 TaxID=2811227 RepID=UPI001B3C30DE|nr:MAG: hypothetical protein J5F18_17015 [Halomonas sp. BM-2019]